MTKVIQITPATNYALAGSVAKWQKIVLALKTASLYEEHGMRDCPLCRLFHPRLKGKDYEDGCGGCPIATDSGDLCDGTPYDTWNAGDEGETLEGAEAMHGYLVNLQAKCVVATEEPATPVN